MKFSEITNNIQSIEKQKDLAKSLLNEVGEYFEFALLAGGAPRNWAFGKPANDLDIYVLRQINYGQQKAIDKKIAEGVKSLSAKYNLGKNRASQTINSNIYGGFILNSLYDFSIPITTKIGEDTVVNNQDCQLIIIDDTKCSYDEPVKSSKDFSQRIFSTYDFGICMTSIDKNGDQFNSHIFHSDVNNKTFTCNIKEFRRSNPAGMKKLVERFEKMQSYFPDHKMKISY